jgi:hypothetical protein
MIQAPELFTGQDCCSDEEVAHEAVVVYREWVTTKSMCRDRFARRVKNADDYYEFFKGNIGILYE